MPEHDRFNPRYSPEFQRGYQPRAPRPPQEQADAGGAPAGASGTEGAGVDEAADADAAIAGPEVDGTEADGGDDPQASAAPSRSSLWRNPYVIVLLVAGVLLIAGGLQLYFRSIESMYTSRESAPQDLVAVQVFWGMAPVLMTAGVFTLIGVGFLAAYQWRQGRR